MISSDLCDTTGLSIKKRTFGVSKGPFFLFLSGFLGRFDDRVDGDHTQTAGLRRRLIQGHLAAANATQRVTFFPRRRHRHTQTLLAGNTSALLTADHFGVAAFARDDIDRFGFVFAGHLAEQIGAIQHVGRI